MGASVQPSRKRTGSSAAASARICHVCECGGRPGDGGVADSWAPAIGARVVIPVVSMSNSNF